MGESKAIAQVLAAYEKLTRQNSRIKALEKKLADGTISLKEAAELNSLRARAFGRALSGKVLDITQGEREGTCTALLREGCDYTDELAQAAQRAVLTRQGLNLTPPTANFEEDRARKIGHSLEDQTVPDETIQRRARSATETMLRSQYDRNMKKGAETCASAGLKTYIVRDSGSGCCKWCDEVSGKFAYGTEPKDVYRRHDNCTCTVTYESGRGRQNVWSKQYWSAEQEKEYLRLRDEMTPKRLNARQAAELREKVGGLTFGRYSDILNLSDSSSLYDFVPETAPKKVPYLDIFGERGKKSFSGRTDAATLNVRHMHASAELLKHIYKDEIACLKNDPNYEPGIEYSIVYDANMEHIKGREKPQKYWKGGCNIISPNVPYHAFHNHGSSQPLGYGDLDGFISNSDMISLTAQGNNGKSKFVIIKTDKFDRDGYEAYLIKKSQEVFYNLQGQDIRLTDKIDKDTFDSLKKDEQDKYLQALTQKTVECLRGGEKYGIKYYCKA